MECYREHGDFRPDTEITFSPLFVGAWSATANNVKVASSRLAIFQSPFRRGMECYYSVRFADRGFGCPFSPLFVGAWSATAYHHMKHALGGSFSPLFVGAWSATQYDWILEMLERTFSPLFVGAWSATPPTLSHSITGFSFQSPFRRGMECYAFCRNAIVVAFRILSVPFSSGHGVLQGGRVRCDTVVQPFSPLFVGAWSATAVVKASRVAVKLSVPFSSGHGVLRRKSGLLEVFPDVTFSPLFVGAWSATPPSTNTRLHSSPFSPLFVGAWSATIPPQINRPHGKAFQSPFRRGMECYVGLAFLRPAKSHNTFSPLFVGAWSATLSIKSGTRKIRELSVPFSSGHGVLQIRSDVLRSPIKLSVPFSSGHGVLLA